MVNQMLGTIPLRVKYPANVLSLVQSGGLGKALNPVSHSMRFRKSQHLFTDFQYKLRLNAVENI